MYEGLDSDLNFLNPTPVPRRTYKRRPLECEVIKDVSALCRLCLGCQPAVPIYGASDVYSTLATRIMMCVGLEMKKDAALPCSICAECYKQIQTCYTFRKSCLITYQKLKKHLQAVKMKEANKTQYLSVENTVDNKNSILNYDLCNKYEVQSDTPNRLCPHKNLNHIINIEDVSESSDKNIVKTENVIENENEDKMLIENTKKELDNKVNASYVKKYNDCKVNIPTESTNKNDNIVNMEGDNSVNIPMESINKELDRILNTKGVNNEYVDIVLVINENSVMLDEKQIDSKNIIELCETAEKQNGLQLNNVSTEQGIRQSEKLTKQNVPSELKVQTEVSSLASVPEELPDPAEHTLQDDISQFITRELIESEMVSVAEGDRLALNRDVNMFLELLATDGSLVTLDVVELDEQDEQEPARIYECSYKNTNADVVVELKKTKKLKKERNTDGHRCPVCHKLFSRRGALRRHSLVHSGERPHRCKHCTKTFAQRSVCARHELTHAEKRPFPCPSCPKSFTQRGALLAHDRAHHSRDSTPLLLHACAHCPKMFLHASGLCRHMKVHDGWSFKCEDCDRYFSDKSSLRRHIKTHRLKTVECTT